MMRPCRRPHAIPERMTPTVEAFFHEATGSYSYVVCDPIARRAAVIDPVLDYDPASGCTSHEAADTLAAFVEQAGLRVEWILETHVHADHLSAAAYLKQRLGGKVGIGRGVCEVQAHCKRIFNMGDGFATDGSQFDRLFAEGDEIEIGALRARVLATAGHTSDSLTYLIDDAAFVGDTLFAPDCGSARCDFAGAGADTLYASIQKLYALPEATRIFLCHDYPAGRRAPRPQTSVAEQKRDNIHLRAGTGLEDFVQMRETRDAGLSLPRLLFPALQVNVRAGILPPAESNGVSYVKIPLSTRDAAKKSG
jgi:glyoxylase-like metal-dependent hydrolase (beta-lactamase superfamily II)